LARTITFDGFV